MSYVKRKKTPMKNSTSIKYLIANEQDVRWGLTINTVGYQSVGKNESYPAQSHPARYLFSTQKGRVLNEYQLLYITQGEGFFSSTNCKKKNVKAGNMFLLFPQEWHNYRPEKSVGWDEYWIGFEGVNIDSRISNAFFSPNKPVFNVGVHEEIIHLYKQAVFIAQEQRPGFQQMLAGIVSHLLGIAYSKDKHAVFEDSRIAKQIDKAKVIMVENFHSNVSLEVISEQLHISYSWFRRIFKQYTGLSPYQYIHELRIQKAKELLTNSAFNSQEIAFEVGFENADYFCTAFKRKTGMSPIKYREFTQGKLPKQK